MALADNIKDPDGSLQEALNKATVEDLSSRTSDAAGTFEGKLKVTFQDKSFIVVENQKLIVTEPTTKDKVTEAGGLKALDITVKKGGAIDWSKGVALADNIKDPDGSLKDALKQATVTDESGRTSDAAGTFEGKLKVTFEDKSFIVVENQKLIVKDSTGPVVPSTKDKVTEAGGLKALDITVKKGGAIDWSKGVALADNIKDPDGSLQEALNKATVEDLSSRTSDAAGTFEGKLKVTFQDKSFIVVENQKLIVKDSTGPVETTDDPVVPYLPDENEPTTGDDGKTIPSDYVIVTLQADNQAHGKITVEGKTGPVVKAKVQPGTDLSKIVSVTAATGYELKDWTPVLGKVTKAETYTANFKATGGGQVDPTTDPVVPWVPGTDAEPTTGDDGKTIPSDYVTVTLKADNQAHGKITVEGKTGPVVKAKVQPGTDLSKIVSVTAATGYELKDWTPVLGKVTKAETYTANFKATGGSGKGTGGSGWIVVPTPGPTNPNANNSSELNKNLPKNRVTSISMAYIFGYEDGTFRPDGSITRAEAAAMLARLAKLDTSDSSRPNFIDVRSGWYNGVINAMVKVGYMKGYPDGTFRPNGKITRAELAQMIIAIDKANRGSAPFADVKNHWARPAIDQAYANGRIKGYPDGSFRPNNSITRAESVTIFNSLFDRHVNEKGLVNVRSDIKNFKDTSSNHWAYYQVVGASNSHEFYREENSFEEIWTRVF